MQAEPVYLGGDVEQNHFLGGARNKEREAEPEVRAGAAASARPYHQLAQTADDGQDRIVEVGGFKELLE